MNWTFGFRVLIRVSLLVLAGLLLLWARLSPAHPEVANVALEASPLGPAESGGVDASPGEEDRGVPPYRIAGDPHGSGSLGSGDGVNWEYVAWSREKLPLKIGGMACSFYTETRGWAGAITIWKENGGGGDER